MTRISTLILGSAVALFAGNALGIALGALIAAFGPMAIARLENRDDVLRRIELENALPTIAMSLAVCAQAGLSLSRALEVCCDLTDSHAKQELERTLRAVQTGYQEQAMEDMGSRVPSWECITYPLARAVSTGAPMAQLLSDIAADQLDAHHERVMIIARRLGVRATVPVALLLLPAFMVLGVVPLVASLAGSLIPSL